MAMELYPPRKDSSTTSTLLTSRHLLDRIPRRRIPCIIILLLLLLLVLVLVLSPALSASNRQSFIRRGMIGTCSSLNNCSLNISSHSSITICGSVAIVKLDNPETPAVRKSLNCSMLSLAITIFANYEEERMDTTSYNSTRGRGQI